MKRKFDALLSDLEQLINSPPPKPKITVMLKKSEPLAKSVRPAQPRLVWTGRSGKVNLPAGIHIEGWS